MNQAEKFVAWLFKGTILSACFLLGFMAAICFLMAWLVYGA